MTVESSREENLMVPSIEKASGVVIYDYQILLGLLVFIHAATGTLLLAVKEYIQEEYVVGIIFSQAYLFALWTAFSEQRFYHRFLWPCFLCIFVSFITELGDIWPSGHHHIGIIMICEMTAYLTISLFFIVIRRFTGWRISRTNREMIDSDYQPRQFGIKHIIYLTTITAVGFALFRTLVVLALNPDMMPRMAEYFETAFILLLIIIPIFTMPWFVLADKETVFRRVFLSVIIFVFFEIMLCSTLPYLDQRRITDGLYAIQVAAGLSVLITLLPLRFCGFRVVRVK